MKKTNKHFYPLSNTLKSIADQVKVSLDQKAANYADDMVQWLKDTDIGESWTEESLNGVRSFLISGFKAGYKAGYRDGELC